MNKGCGEGPGQETWDFVMTAMVLTLGDTGATWHYTLTARRGRQREKNDERREEGEDIFLCLMRRRCRPGNV